jgi:hypothetical protein
MPRHQPVWKGHEPYPVNATPSPETLKTLYDNAIAEASTGCFTTELLRPHGSWRGCDELELVTLKYVD